MSGRCSDLCTLANQWRRIYAETRSILLPVLLCICLTQVAWVGVYDCTVTRNLFPFDSQDSLTDGLANAALAMIVIAFISGLMIALAIYQFKRTVESWLSLSCIVVSFVITGSIFQDGAVRLLPGLDENTQLAIAGSLTTVYGSGAVMAFFTKHLPAWFHQLYVITNCASIAAFYLTALPSHTAWFLLAAVVLWDIFAVLAPIGPLKIALERSSDYGADILRFMMFTAEGEDSSSGVEEEGESVTRPVQRLSAGADMKIKDQSEEEESAESGDEESEVEEEGDASGDSSDDYSSSSSSSAPIISSDVAPAEEKNAREALNSGSHLGFGDFIFYSILVGRSMATGLLPAIYSTLCVLIGLAYTLSIPHDQETLPALPISIILGMTGHFSTVALMGAVEFLYDAYSV
ncbi:hypothetical protein PENTCL1PPCAC_24815 [Pristionchus entomophagus]|uniref:Presenilin n=1 Tax=Pristionchus entomophagus TaxID=358040 RepID=A0AAV5U6Y2_9BILA|nr:hypothetical protein PENTCL1PPCAC_24815 [Pristionchus entomophagus]